MVVRVRGQGFGWWGLLLPIEAQKRSVWIDWWTLRTLCGLDTVLNNHSNHSWARQVKQLSTHPNAFSGRKNWYFHIFWAASRKEKPEHLSTRKCAHFWKMWPGCRWFYSEIICVVERHIERLDSNIYVTVGLGYGSWNIHLCFSLLKIGLMEMMVADTCVSWQQSDWVR